MPPLALVFLLVGTAAAAQAFPLARERQERRITLSTGPDSAVPEVHVAPGVLTTLVFDAPVERASVDLDERVPLFSLVDVGEQLLTLEPRAEVGPGKKLGLRVRLKDGTVAALMVAAHPTQVDTRVDVERPRSREALLAELVEARAELAALRARAASAGPAGMVFAGLLDKAGVRATSFKGRVPPNQSGLTLGRGMNYRAGGWALVSVKVHNLPGQKPWTPGQARLFGAGGLEVKVLAVHLARGALLPGESALVVVETGALPQAAGEVFRLELVDKDGGRSLAVDGMNF